MQTGLQVTYHHNDKKKRCLPKSANNHSSYHYVYLTTKKVDKFHFRFEIINGQLYPHLSFPILNNMMQMIISVMIINIPSTLPPATCKTCNVASEENNNYRKDNHQWLTCMLYQPFDWSWNQLLQWRVSCMVHGQYTDWQTSFMSHLQSITDMIGDATNNI